jgi:hypothetical protein
MTKIDSSAEPTIARRRPIFCDRLATRMHPRIAPTE